jgi:hypothetical protein
MVEFGGWEMPLNYLAGILAEHLTTRKFGGLDIFQKAFQLYPGAHSSHILQDGHLVLEVRPA